MCVGNSAHIIVIIGSKCTNKIRLIANSHRWAQGGIGTISGVERVIVRNGAVCILQHDAVVFILPGGRAIVPMLDSRQAGKFVFRFIIVADVILQQPAIAGHVRPLDGGGFPTAGNLAGLGIVGRRCAGNDVHLHGRGGDGRSGRNGGLPPLEYQGGTLYLLIYPGFRTTWYHPSLMGFTLTSKSSLGELSHEGF